MDFKELRLAPLKAFDDKWALLTAGKEAKFNTMTISWGGFGTIWNKPIVTVYVKPIRYTYEFMESNEYFTISFFDEEYKSDLTLLGSKSGRDFDKIKETKLTIKPLDKIVTFNEADLVIICKKIYAQDLDLSQIPEEQINLFYQKEAVHRMYFGEIVDIIYRR